jgi:hypothetical protein
MPVIGFRCFPDGFSYVVLDGDQERPTVVSNLRVTFPKDLAWGAKLSWCRRQAIEVLDQSQISAAGLKSAEPVAKTKSLPRSEVEGVITETLSSHLGIECASRIKSQLKRDISGFDQPARYLERVLTATHLEHLNGPVFQDATLAAIAELPEHA